MGMYTELHFNAELSKNTPDEVLEILLYMTDTDIAMAPPPVPDHPFFRMAGWQYFLRMNSAYFPLSSASSIEIGKYHPHGEHELHVRCCNKGGTTRFLDWVMPYVEAGDECLGYYRYEESDHPTLIYKTGSRYTGVGL